LAVIGTSAGKIKLIDVEKNRVMWKEEFGEKNIIYDVDWGKNGIMVVGGAPRELFIRKFEKAS
jgi:hypothetical protein